MEKPSPSRMSPARRVKTQLDRRRAESEAERGESALVAGLRAGDDASFALLVTGHGGRMLSVARRMLGDEEDARDCVQDAFLQAFRRVGTFREDASLATWLHRIVVNAALMRIRQRARRPSESIEDLLPRFDEDGLRVDPGARHAPSPDRLLERAQSAERVRRAIDRLPGGYRNVLLLRDIEDLDTEETARLLDMTAGAIKTRLHRARAALKSMLESAGEGTQS